MRLTVRCVFWSWELSVEAVDAELWQCRTLDVALVNSRDSDVSF